MCLVPFGCVHPVTMSVCRFGLVFAPAAAKRDLFATAVLETSINPNVNHVPVSWCAGLPDLALLRFWYTPHQCMHAQIGHIHPTHVSIILPLADAHASSKVRSVCLRTVWKACSCVIANTGQTHMSITLPFSDAHTSNNVTSFKLTICVCTSLNVCKALWETRSSRIHKSPLFVWCWTCFPDC